MGDAFKTFPPLEYTKPNPDEREKAMELAKPLTPRSERPRASYGSLEISVQTVKGLCQAGRKCVRKDKHSGECWPV